MTIAKAEAKSYVIWALLTAPQRNAAVVASHKGLRYRTPGGTLITAPHNNMVCPLCASEAAQRGLRAAGILGNVFYP